MSEKLSEFHSNEELLLFARMCRVLYRYEGETWTEGGEKCGLRNIAPLIITEDEVMIGTMDHRTLVVVYMGSNGNVHDWASNFNFFSTRSGWGWSAHRGFLETALEFMEPLGEYRKSLGTEPTRVIFMGHSRGGGQSNVMAAQYKHTHPKDEVELVTFGSPRVFKRKGIENVPLEKISRVTNNGDRVSVYPPAAFGFRHLGKAINFPGKWWDRIPVRNPLKCHHIDEYIKELIKRQ